MYRFRTALRAKMRAASNSSKCYSKVVCSVSELVEEEEEKGAKLTSAKIGISSSKYFDLSALATLMDNK